MSILKTTKSGMNAPFTEELALSLGYTIRCFDKLNPKIKIWNPPARITENIKRSSCKNAINIYPLWSNQFGVFFNQVFANKDSIIDRLYHLNMLEKYWTSETDEECTLYAILSTKYNPNRVDIEKLKRIIEENKKCQS